MLEQKYEEYLKECGEKARYSKETANDMDEFFELACTFCGVGEAETLYERMLNIATSFEESGFMAGYDRGTKKL